MYSIKNRNRFHSDYKIAIALNLISPNDLKYLPKSTRSRLLNTSFEEFADLIGLNKSSSFDFSNPDLPEKLDIIRKFARSNTAIRLFKAALMIYNTIVSIFLTYGFFNIKEINVKQKIVSTINRVKNIIGFDRAVRYFKIAKSTCYNWLKQISYSCTDSTNGLCLRFFPSQLTIMETDSFKEIVINKLKLFWPFSSIWGYAFSKGIINFSYTTFLRYIKMLKLGDKIRRYKRKRKQGLVTTAPNQFWHADVTIYKTLNGIKTYIYLLIDNFSNFILSYRVSTTLSATIRKETVKDAYDKYGNHNPKIIYSDVFPLLNADLTIENYYTHLLTDGGSENKGALDYLRDPDVRIKKLIAMQDIDYSNSAIKALNKIVKYQDLHLVNIPDVETVELNLNEWIPVYNNERPNRKGCYLMTPFEIYNGKIIDKTSIKKRINQARTERILYNRTHSCGICD
jgi:hypothetical protein